MNIGIVLLAVILVTIALIMARAGGQQSMSLAAPDEAILMIGASAFAGVALGLAFTA